jgi:hypothetical protein
VLAGEGQALFRIPPMSWPPRRASHLFTAISILLPATQAGLNELLEGIEAPGMENGAESGKETRTGDEEGVLVLAPEVLK